MDATSRLFNYFKPDTYDITWDLTDISNRNLRGQVVISGEQTNDDAIYLHAADMEITAVKVDGEPITTFTIDKGIVTIPHGPAGNVAVELAFTLTVSDAMHGIYPGYYKVNKQPKELFATQFESHHAREAFPCVDEPEAKAIFTVNIIAEEGLTVLSNTPVEAEETTDGTTHTVFEPSPRMSSYLVAFAIGDFQKKVGTTKSGVDVGVYATKAQNPESLDYALTEAIGTIEFFEDYFGVAYPLPKSDHVALPDFTVGAMENWGMITYREVALLADPKTASLDSKEYVSTVIAHELSHQWFGNLVTMKWWNDLWLNESFANNMEYVATDARHPKWNMWLQFSNVEAMLALRRDAIDGVQPVQVEVREPDEINAVFDGAIVYAKGGRLIRMMMQYVGEVAFRKGLTQYFETHRYSNTTGDDLWKAIGEASGKDIASLMHTWISQPGYPVVHATLSDGEVHLRQEQFFIGDHEPSERLWPIPLDASNPDFPALMSEQELTVPFDHAGSLQLNRHDCTHMLTHYDTKLLGRLLGDISKGKLSTLNRMQLLHEQTLLARGGVIKSSQLIDLLEVYRDERDEKVWDIMSGAIGDLKKFVEADSEGEASLKAFVRDLAQPLYEELGWQPQANEAESTSKLRATIISLMLYGEDQHAIDTAKTKYASGDFRELQPELRTAIMTASVRYADDPQVVTQLVEAYQHEPSADLQSDICDAATATQNEDMLRVLIDTMKDTKIIRPQDTVRWFVRLLANRHSRTLTWQWLRDNWEWIDKTFGGDKSFDAFPRYSASILTTRTQYNEYTEFFTPLKTDVSLTRTITIGIRELESRVATIEREAPSVIERLNAYHQS